MTSPRSANPTSLPEPFAYPTQTHSRRHGPRGYADYTSYKPWLRDEFMFRCVYCLSREAWYPNGTASFSVDHVEPQALHPDLTTDYGNLVYACNRCNSFKLVESLPDPTKVAFDELLRIDDEGRITPRTDAGRVIIERLKLDDEAAVAARVDQLLLIAAKQRYPDDPDIDRMFRARFGFPLDMEDLRRRRPPEGNAEDGSEEHCYFARNERGELPPVY